MIKMKKVLIVVLFLIYSFPYLLTGQVTKKLFGQVIDSKSLQPVAYATIAVALQNTGVISDEKGFFTILVPSDTSTLIISSVGYKNNREKLVPGKVSSFYYFKLEEEVKQLNEVTVVAEKDRIARVSSGISSVKMSPVLVAKLPNMGEVDVLRSFQLLPGVSATNETSAGLYVRGGTPDQNLLLFDGMTIYHVDHFYGFFSAFNANSIDDIELLKGGFPAKYGGRTSSVMVITGRPADFQKVNGTASLSLLSLNGAIEVPILKNKLSLQIAVRRSYTDIIRTKLFNKIFNIYSDNSGNIQPQNMPSGGFGRMQLSYQQPSFYFYDLNSKLTWKLNDRNTFALSLYSGKDNLDNSRDMSTGFGFPGFSSAESSERTDIAGWGNTGISGQWHKQWNNSFSSSVFVSSSNYFSNRDIKSTSSSNSENTPSTRPGMNTLEDNNVKDISLRLRNEWQLNDNNLFEFGVEQIDNKISYKLVFNDTLTGSNKIQNGFQTAFYLQDKLTFFDKKLELNPGFRTTYYNVTEKVYYEPRFSSNYKVNEKLKLKAAFGLYNQYITRIIRDDILQGSKDFWLMADDSLISVSSSEHYITGFSYEKGSYFFDVEAYYKKLSGLTEYSARSTTIGRRDGANRQDLFYRGTGYAKGIEFMIQKKFGLNTGWIAYTLSEVKYKYPDLNFGKSFYALHDQTHEFKSVYSRKLGNWDLSATLVFATGKAYTAPVSQYQLTLLDGSKYNYIHVSDKNSLRLPDYHKMDLSASYNWIGKEADKTLSVSIFNVYNRKNIWYKEFDIQENVMNVTDVTYLGFTPNISFTIRFK
jgi:ferric enterobactin receptor